MALAEMSRAVMRCKLTPRPDAWRIVPLAALHPLDAERLDAERRQVVTHALGDGLHLGVGAPAADDEVVPDGRERAGLEYHQIVRLAIERRPRAFERPVPAGERHQDGRSSVR